MTGMPDWPYCDMRERCEIWSAAVATLLCIAWGLIGTRRLFRLVRVVPACFSELKLENFGNFCEYTYLRLLQNSENYWLCGGKEFYIHCPQVEICPVPSFDLIGENMRHRLVVSTLVTETRKLGSMGWLYYTPANFTSGSLPFQVDRDGTIGVNEGDGQTEENSCRP